MKPSYLEYAAKRTAFTLVELLVVITVIGLLAGLLLPAVNYARGRAQQTQCLNNQRNIGIALVGYAMDNNGLPGLTNRMGTLANGVTPRIINWVTAILPQLEENRRYELLAGDTPDVATATESDIPFLLCPSFNLKPKQPGTPNLAYVVNAGPTDTNREGDTIDAPPAYRSPLYTLFGDRANVSGSNIPYKKRKLDDTTLAEGFPDGKSNTILLSESIQAYSWAPAYNTVASMGFLWTNKDDDPATELRYRPNTGDPTAILTAPDIKLARPSSIHPNIVMCLYADGSVKPVSDKIGEEDASSEFGSIYLSAVCPDDASAKKATTMNGLGYTWPSAAP